MTFEEARARLMKYCAYQERSHQEVESKLRSIGAPQNIAEQVILYLIENNFLNEERFARAFAGGKFRTRSWGRMRIIRELENRNVSPYCIQKALEEIPEQDYLESMQKVIDRKSVNIRPGNLFAYRNKVAQHAIRKGYEPQLVWDYIMEKFPD